MELLNKAGIDFDELALNGIPIEEFSNEFRKIGLVESPDITWLAFNSKYDFAYLLSLFGNLPLTKIEFLQSIRDLFPRRFDVKHLGTGSLKTQLEQEGIDLSGQHQAGVDSFVTMQLFWSKAD